MGTAGPSGLLGTLRLRGTPPAAVFREIVRPATRLLDLTREKVRPAPPLQQLFREKTRPARHKTPILGHFERAGRTFSRSLPLPGHAGRTSSRTGGGDVAMVQPPPPLRPLLKASMKPPSPLRTPEQRPLKPTTPLRPKNTTKRPFLTRKGDGGFNPTHVRASKGDAGFRQLRHAQPHARSSEKSHVIRSDQPLNNTQNVEIPTNTIQILKLSQGNYVRNC